MELISKEGAVALITAEMDKIRTHSLVDGTARLNLRLAKNIIEDMPSIDLADYVPKDFHDKTCEAMAKRHQEEIADILERADVDRPQGWIPCSERLPRESGYYLCCNNGYLPYVGHFINGRWSDFDCTIVHADAWMPLPKPYGEREGE